MVIYLFESFHLAAMKTEGSKLDAAKAVLAIEFQSPCLLR